MKRAGYIAAAIALLTLQAYGAPNSVDQNQEVERDLFLKDKTINFVNLEFLYWFVNEGATDFALKMNSPPWSTTVDSYATGKYQSADFGWSPGLRVSIGHFNAPHYWDVIAQYTYLQTTGTDHVHAPGTTGEFLVGSWIGPDFSTTNAAAPLQEASSWIKLSYQIADLLFSRRFHPNPHLRVNMIGGGTGAFLSQRWHVHYTDINGQRSLVKNSWQFSGGGLRLGLKLDWFMGWNVFLTALASSALVSGPYTNRAFQSTTAPVAGANNQLPFFNIRFHDWRLLFNYQMLAGPSWQKAFKRVRTEIFAGYEFTIWTNLHQIYRSNRTGATAGKDTYINSSDLTLQGLTVRWNLDF